MIEFNAYVRNPLAPRIFVNNIGGVYRLDGASFRPRSSSSFGTPI
jgi:hypothetical protein